jgi:hypothetical protein
MEQRERIHRYLVGIIRGMEGVPHAVGGTADHVHLFAGLRATHCLADVMREVKAIHPRGFTARSDSRDFIGRRATAHSRSVPRISRRCESMCCARRSTIGEQRFKTSMCVYCRRGWWNMMTGICGEAEISRAPAGARMFAVSGTGGSARSSLHHRLISVSPAGLTLAPFRSVLNDARITLRIVALRRLCYILQSSPPADPGIRCRAFNRRAGGGAGGYSDCALTVSLLLACCTICLCILPPHWTLPALPACHALHA